MSSARRTYSDRSPLLIDARYRWMAFLIFSTNRFHVSGATVPSSKNERETFASGIWADELDINEVANGRVGGCVAWTAPAWPRALCNATDDPFCDRDLLGLRPPRESNDVAGERPADRSDPRRRCDVVS